MGVAVELVDVEVEVEVNEGVELQAFRGPLPD